jgi:hypothetical protein
VPADAGLRETVERLLGLPIAGLRTRPYAYRTSNPLAELDIELAAGERVRLLLKDLSCPHGAKPGFLHDPAREVQVYRRLLMPTRLGPAVYGVDRNRILMEKVNGTELWQLEHAAWLRTARWLASTHAALAGQAGEPSLLRLDRRFYAAWPARADLDTTLKRAYERASARLLALPRIVIHNDLYPSNVLVAGQRIVAVDWELAAAGPGVLDLAALVSGWDENRAAAILAAYGRVDERDLVAAQLHLAVRWLGWGARWTPPPEHARDWHAEARKAARRLDG